MHFDVELQTQAIWEILIAAVKKKKPLSVSGKLSN